MRKYRYEAARIDNQERPKEAIESEFIHTETGIEFRSRITSREALEQVSIQMDRDGRFISGKRNITPRPSGPTRQERIWREGPKVFLEREAEGGKKEKAYEIPRNKELAVDGSLLALLPSFPFNEGKEWNMFMVDFSGYSITATVRQEGVERVTVPAGEFPCYRIEVVVNIPILRPKIIFWIWTEKPHFLVKHEGKRGPFTPIYLTSLVSLE